MEKYCDTNLNYYIKVKLTEEGRIIYKKHYAKYNCEAPKLNIGDEGYVQFQIHEFMNIFGERLFMGATLPCETNCKIQVKDEWHYPSKGELPDHNGQFYVALKGKTETFILNYDYDEYNEGKMVWLDDDGTNFNDEVYAWREKLEAPKEVE